MPVHNLSFHNEAIWAKWGPPIQDSLGAAADARDAGDAQIGSLEYSKIRSLQKSLGCLGHFVALA